MSEDAHWPEDMTHPPTHEEILDSFVPGDETVFPSSGYRLTVAKVDRENGEISFVEPIGKVVTGNDNYV